MSGQFGSRGGVILHRRGDTVIESYTDTYNRLLKSPFFFLFWNDFVPQNFVTNLTWIANKITLIC